MEFNSYIGLDVHKEAIAVAIAEAGRAGEVRFYSEIANTPDAVASLLKKLGGRRSKLHFVYEAGPCGYGLYRQILAAGHACDVISPAHTPKRAGDHVKTDRRDAAMLARLSRAGELTAVWVPDETHEAMRDLICAREVTTKDVRQARQRIQGFLLRYGRRYVGAVWSRRRRCGRNRRHAALRQSRQLMEFVGLVPGEHSSGSKRKLTGITKAGSVVALRLTVESAWGNRMPAKIGQAMMLRQQSIPVPIREIAWKAQIRLCGRCRRMLARGKKAPNVITVIARALLGFIWAIARHVEPKTIAA